MREQVTPDLGTSHPALTAPIHHFLVFLLDALVAGTLFTEKRWRWLFPLAVSALALVLVRASEPRTVGDAGEYIAMSVNLARLSAPSLSADEVEGRRQPRPSHIGATSRHPAGIEPEVPLTF